MKRIGLRSGLAAAALMLCSGSAFAQQAAKHPITFDDMIRMHRVSEPQVSPDGKWVAYTVATPDMDANRNASNIWLVSTESGAPIQLTQSGHDIVARMVPGRQNDRFPFLARRRVAGLPAVNGRRRSPSLDASLHRCGHRQMVS